MHIVFNQHWLHNIVDLCMHFVLKNGHAHKMWSTVIIHFVDIQYKCE